MKNFFLAAAATNATDADYKDMQTILLNESFVSVPSDWTNNGFTVNNGLEASGIGGMGTNITYNLKSFLDRMTVKVEFVVNDLTSSFAVAKNLAQRGNVAKVDLNANTLQLGVLTNQGIEPTYKFSTTLTNISKVIGHTYIIELTKDRQKMSCKIYDKSSESVFDEIVRDYDIDITFAGSAWGPPSAIFFSGDIKITNFKYIALSPERPKIGIYGDSITEGYTLIDQPGNLKSRWADKLWESNNGNLFISAQGGISTGGTLDYIDFEQSHLIPKYTILLLGANDSNYNTWLSNYESIISKIEAIGSIPVLCTILPFPGKEQFVNAANSEILFQKSQVYNVIDMAASVTFGRDRNTWITEYLLPDNVHPTVEGHQAMYNEILNNNNYLM